MLAYFDCRNGISGDMTLAALVDLGLDLAPLQFLLADAGIDCTLSAWSESRAAGPGQRVDVSWSSPQPLRHPADIEAVFNRVAVSSAVRAKALRVLAALTEAEAHAHNIPAHEVHFHEVGAIDTLVDILGVAWGLEVLGIDRVVTSPLPLFSGWIDCDHGRLPLPAPATAWLMQGKALVHTEATTELVTPTGAALVHGLMDCGTAWGAGKAKAMGTGYGSRPSTSGLRVWLMEEAATNQPGPAMAAACGGQQDEILQMECHLDHLTGEELGAALEALAAMPAVVDVLWLPGLTKKNRPGGLLRLLCQPADGPQVSAALVRHTHSLGLRWQILPRIILPRRAVTMPAGSGPHAGLAAKAYEIDGKTCIRPECDALKEAAQRENTGLPSLRLQAL